MHASSRPDSRSLGDLWGITRFSGTPEILIFIKDIDISVEIKIDQYVSWCSCSKGPMTMLMALS